MTLIFILVLANRRSLLGLGRQRHRWPAGSAVRASWRVAGVASVYVVLTVLSWFGVG